MDFQIRNDNNEEYILPDTFDSDPTSFQEEFAPEVNDPMVRLKYEYDGIDQVSNSFLEETKVPLPFLYTPNSSETETSLSSLLTIEQRSVYEFTSDVKLQNSEIQNQIKRELETVTEISTKRNDPISSDDVSNKTTPLIDNNFGAKQCLAPYCKFTYNKNAKIQLHDVPLDEYLRKQWFDSLSQAHTQIGSFFLVDPLREKQSVCSRHFTEEDFRTYFTYKSSRQEISSRILLEKAVPSIYEDSREFPFFDEEESAVRVESHVRFEPDINKKFSRIEEVRLQKSFSVVPSMEELYTMNHISGADPNVIQTEYPKPPVSLFILQALALLNRTGRGLCMREIDEWIKENFPFFKTAKVMLSRNGGKKNVKTFLKKIQKTSQSHKLIWTINEKNKGKLLRLIEQKCLKDLKAVQKAMSNPDALELMMKGEFKKYRS